MPNILIVTTSHSQMGDSGKPTGLWLEELAVPYYRFFDDGATVDIASIKGGAVPIDPASQKADGENSPSVERFLKDEAAQRLFESSIAIEAVDPSKYDAIFLPGGHGTMWDLPKSDRLAQIVSETLEQGRVVAAVCHGPAGLVSAKNAGGEPVVKGRNVSAFTNSEEVAVGLSETVPFLLESKLEMLGAEVQKAEDFQAFAVADGNLITGQNPLSSDLVAQKVLIAIDNNQ